MSALDFNLSEAAKCFNQKQYQQAIEWYNKAEQAGNQSVQLYFHRGACYYNLDDNYAAIDDLEKALAIAPEDATAANLLGDAYYKDNCFDDAIEAYSRSFYYDEKNYQALHWRLLARLQLKDGEGKIFNRDAAQQDADMLLPVAEQFFGAEKEDGTPYEIVKLEIAEDGGLIIKVK